MPESKYVCTLSDELLAKAKEELNEDPARRDEDIEAIKQWLKKQPHMKARLDDAFLLRFLRTAKFSLERTKEKLDNYYTVRTAIPEWFGNLDPNDPKLQELARIGTVIPLDGYDKFGRRVVIIRTGAHDPSKHKYEETMRISDIISEIQMRDEQSQICGVIGILDFTNFSGSHLTQYSISTIRKSMACWQDCSPVRIKGMHYWNPPSFFDKAFSLFKPFMKEKMKRRLFFHGADLKSLHEHIPKEILPEEYGGTAGKMQVLIDKTWSEVQKNRDWYLEQVQFKVEESKRPGKPKTQEDIFGIEGSFRKLEID